MPIILLKFVNGAASALAWIGRQGTRAIASLVILGIALPSLGSLFKPFVTEAVFALLCIAFLRVDTASLRIHLGRPRLVIASTIWSSLAVPIIFGGVFILSGLKNSSPGLFLALMFQAATSPMMASPALAALMGLDATLVLITMLTSTALIPLSAPLFIHFFVGSTIELSPLALGVKLFVVLAGSAVVGLALRRTIGKPTIESQKDAINGLNVIVLFVFVAAIMEDVGPRFMIAPMEAAGLCALAFAMFFALLFSTILVFGLKDRENALAVGFMVSQRNLGLMLAATGGAVPELVLALFWAIAVSDLSCSADTQAPFKENTGWHNGPGPEIIV